MKNIRNQAIIEIRKGVRAEQMVAFCLFFCVGVNLVWGKKVRVANLLPAVILSAATAFLPINI